MYKFVVFTLLLTIASAISETIFEDEYGELYQLVPASRQKRQTQVGVGDNGQGNVLDVSHTGNIFANEKHRLDATGFASKHIKPNGPLVLGGQADYKHFPSGSELRAGVINTQRLGTDVSLAGKTNVFTSDNGNHKVDVGANWSRHYGGPFGTGPATAGGNVEYSHVPTGSGLNVGASRTGGFGTDVGVTGKLNLGNWNDGNTRLDAGASWSRHYGGPFGTGRPNYGGGLTFSHRW